MPVMSTPAVLAAAAKLALVAVFLEDEVNVLGPVL